MEVSGRKQAPSNIAMECNPCNQDDRKAKAKVFCRDCEEYLCRECESYHRKLRITRDHSLKDVTIQSPDYTCKEHTDEAVKFYCNDHDVAGCGTCATLNHRTCKVDYILEQSEIFKKSGAYLELHVLIDRIMEHLGQLQSRAKDLDNSSESIDLSTLNEIRTFRAHINAQLDEKEHRILQKAHEFREENTNTITKINDFQDQTLQQIDKYKSDIEQYQDDIERLFVFTKRTLPHLKMLDTDCLRHSQTEIDNYIFKPSERLKMTLQADETIGELKILTGKLNVTEVVPVIQYIYNIKDVKDAKQPAVIGIVVFSPSKFLVADRDNNSLKLMDRSRLCVTTALRLGGPPAGITRLPGEQVAVTMLHQRKIKIVSTSESLKQVREIAVSGDCYGICYCDGTLIVSYMFPGKLEILDLDGNVVMVIEKDNDGKQIFNKPNYLTFHQTRIECAIYVSDYGTNTLTKLSTNGEVLSQINDKKLNPRGLAVVETGTVVVCNSSGNKLYLFTEENGELQECNQWACAKHPWVVDYSKEHNELYLFSNSSEEAGNIYVYTLQESLVNTVK